MFKSIIKYILNNIFKINTQTTDKEIDDNSKYAKIYEIWLKTTNYNVKKLRN